mmetsp:Transcript_2829/g.9185  ORF Transcript_2829/g.9185 Transcript_2829/m.9185 type:complete len:236 (+) Transcript_2829:973-1680(+)
MVSVSSPSPSVTDRSMEQGKARSTPAVPPAKSADAAKTVTSHVSRFVSVRPLLSSSRSGSSSSGSTVHSICTGPTVTERRHSGHESHRTTSADSPDARDGATADRVVVVAFVATTQRSGTGRTVASGPALVTVALTERPTADGVDEADTVMLATVRSIVGGGGVGSGGRVGVGVGAVVGDAVGDAVGDSDGLGVGAGVGKSVGRGAGPTVVVDAGVPVPPSVVVEGDVEPVVEVD